MTNRRARSSFSWYLWDYASDSFKYFMIALYESSEFVMTSIFAPVDTCIFPRADYFIKMRAEDFKIFNKVFESRFSH